MDSLKPHIQALLFVSLLALSVVGCSTFEVQNFYVPTADSSKSFEQLTDGASMSLQFSPSWQFYSIGVLGMPVIPVNARSGDPDELYLELNLNFQQDMDFSVPLALCIVSDSQQQLCSDEVDLRALGMYQDSSQQHEDNSPRWRHVTAFSGKPQLTRKLPLASDDRLSRSDIYRHYGYSGSTPWTSMTVNIRYHYTCLGACPKQFTLAHKELVILHDKSIGGRQYTFAMKTNRDYHFTRNVQ